MAILENCPTEPILSNKYYKLYQSIFCYPLFNQYFVILCLSKQIPKVFIMHKLYVQLKGSLETLFQNWEEEILENCHTSYGQISELEQNRPTQIGPPGALPHPT